MVPIEFLRPTAPITLKRSSSYENGIYSVPRFDSVIQPLYNHWRAYLGPEKDILKNYRYGRSIEYLRKRIQ